MDKAKHIILQHESKLKWVFISSSILHLLCNYSRTDYNLPLYILLLFAWEPNTIGTCNRVVGKEERTYSYLLLLSCIIFDILWLIAYNNKSILLYGFDYGMFIMTFYLTIAGIVIKVGLSIALGLIEWEMLKMYLPKNGEGLQGQQPNTGSRKEMMIEDNKADDYEA